MISERPWFETAAAARRRRLAGVVLPPGAAGANVAARRANEGRFPRLGPAEVLCEKSWFLAGELRALPRKAVDLFFRTSFRTN